jgi:histidine decarboxylase
LGYQVNQKLDYAENLSRYLDFHINNIGDPFQNGNLTTNTKFIERAVLDYFASLWRARWPYSHNRRESYWGYVLSMGSSEGNIYAMWNARDYLAGKRLVVDKDSNRRNGGGAGILASRDPQPIPENPNAFTPIAFYSAETHYSIIKNMRILNIESFYSEAVKKGYNCPLQYPGDYPQDYSKEYIGANGWPFETPSENDGGVYIPALKKLVAFFAEKGYPPMLIFNFGTTFKGAYDDVQAAMKELKPVLESNGLYERKVNWEEGRNDIRSCYWTHVDGALGAAYMPFLEKSGEKNLPVFDFRIPELHSICMSGRKWIGSPWPCGIFMSKVKYQINLVENPEYIGSDDTTFSGSRNGFSALILWDFISRNSVGDLTRRANKCEETAQYALKKLDEAQKAHKELDLWIEYSPHALTVRFRQAVCRLVFKYSLSNETLYVKNEKRNYSHIYLMDSVTHELIDRFVEDLKAEDAFKIDADGGAAVHGRGRGFR